MSERFPGGIISKTAPVPTGPYENGTAPGIWTLEQQAEFVRQGIWPIAGNAPPYIEDVFSTWLYTGNGTSQTINNGIDLAGKGGLVWLKRRNLAESHILFDTARSTGSGDPFLQTNTTDPQFGATTNYLTYLSNGFTLDTGGTGINSSGDTQVSWTFREQPKFFDVVTYTGNDVDGRSIPHNLGSVPGCIIVKNLTRSTFWAVYHRGLSSPDTNIVKLNATEAQTFNQIFNGAPTSTAFTVSFNGTFETNFSGDQYVAYLFAHNAGGFGLSGTDNVISCGSFTTDGSGLATVNLGYEPQWVMVKRTDGSSGWFMQDVMRGYTADATSGTDAILFANTSAAESSATAYGGPNATGFTAYYNASATYIYIAIRRGPMRTPTTGTSVFSPILANVSNTTKLTTNFPVDLSITNETAGGGAYWMDRLRGALSPGLTGNTPYLQSSNTGADTLTPITSGWDNTGLLAGPFFGGVSAVRWNLRRAPGFFDEVCYTGTGSATTQAHNLGVVPELMIVKRRNGIWDWMVYTATDGAEYYYWMNATNARRGPWTGWNNTTPTSSVFSLGAEDAVNASGSTYVNYLFASCPGVSKVGSYTGTGTTQVINCGFTTGARFVLIKATSTTGDWYVWDSARGIVAGNDPYLELNTTDAEVTNTDWVDTAASGFELSNAGGNLANSNGVSYIFLAIA